MTLRLVFCRGAALALALAMLAGCSSVGPEGAGESSPVPDTVPPVIDGARDMTTELGTAPSYRSDVTAVDQVDGVLTLQVDASQVDLNTPGDYPVTYSATDKSGNTASVTVTLTVLEPLEEELDIRPEDDESAGEESANSGTDAAETASVQVTREMVDELADQILAKITTPKMSQRQKAQAIFDYVSSHIAFVGTSNKSSWLVGAYVGFTQRRGDCYNYFACSKALLTRAGIPNVDIRRVGGKADHYWQAVNVGNGYYHFDACPHAARFPINSFLITDAEAMAYSARRGDDYYTYDHAACPVDVVDGEGFSGSLPAAGHAPPAAAHVPPVADDVPPAEEVPANHEGDVEETSGELEVLPGEAPGEAVGQTPSEDEATPPVETLPEVESEEEPSWTQQETDAPVDQEGGISDRGVDTVSDDLTVQEGGEDIQ